MRKDPVCSACAEVNPVTNNPWVPGSSLLGESSNWLAKAGFISLVVSPIAVALIWAIVVDRVTIPRANRSPEDNVESRWFDTAAKNALLGTWVVAGVGAALTKSLKTDLPAVSITLLAICGIMAVIFVASFLWEKRRGQ